MDSSRPASSRAVAVAEKRRRIFDAVSLLLMAAFDGLLHRVIFDPDRVDPGTVLRDILGLLQTALEPTRARGKLKRKLESR